MVAICFGTKIPDTSWHPPSRPILVIVMSGWLAFFIVISGWMGFFIVISGWLWIVFIIINGCLRVFFIIEYRCFSIVRWWWDDGPFVVLSEVVP